MSILGRRGRLFGERGLNAFGVNTGGGGFTGLLDDYPGAAAAYSLRLLDNTYTGSAIRVRRSSDNTEQDIGFVNNELDTASLLSFVGGGDGFVTTWYDQSGSGNDATQTSASNQPQIVSGGGLILEGGKPLIDFQSLQFLNTPSLNLLTAISLQRVDALTTVNYVLQNVSPAGGLVVAGSVSGVNGTGVFDGTFKSMTNTEIGYRLTYWNYTGSNFDVANNGSSIVSLSNGSNAMSSINAIGRSNGLSATQYLSKSAEIICYPTDQSANRTGIETNIANYYGITL